MRFEYFDLLEESNISHLIKTEQPEEFYNLGAQSFVKASFDLPILTSEVNAIGVLRILEAIRHFSPKTKFYQASTSEMFGNVQAIPQNETTPFYPRSPYGVAKLYAHWTVVNYRESYNLFACSGILFNHESEYRGKEFVTQKIVKKIVAQRLGDKSTLKLGNMDAERDWGYARDYVEGMYLMLQQNEAEDYVLATNSKISVRKFVELSYKEMDISIKWTGSGLEEKGTDENTGEILVEVSKDFYRPSDVNFLIGDYTKAKHKLNWTPKTDIESLIKIMINDALNRAKSKYPKIPD